MIEVTLTVRGIGQLREPLGDMGVTIMCAPIAAAVLDQLQTQIPAITATGEGVTSDGVALATDTAYLAPDAAVHDGMQLVLIPPVSGG